MVGISWIPGPGAKKVTSKLNYIDAQSDINPIKSKTVL